jgi:hypothetical protein
MARKAKIIITNVHIINGRSFGEPATIVVDVDNEASGAVSSFLGLLTHIFTSRVRKTSRCWLSMELPLAWIWQLGSASKVFVDVKV